MPHAATALKIFLADDSELIRTRVAAMLGAPSMIVVGQAATAQASIDGILRSRPDVVVLDAQLQEGTGLDVLRAVLGRERDIAFVVFSHNSTPPYRKRYLEAGAVAFLDKSTQFDQLAQAVADAPRRAHAARA